MKSLKLYVFTLFASAAYACPEVGVDGLIPTAEVDQFMAEISYTQPLAGNSLINKCFHQGEPAWSAEQLLKLLAGVRAEPTCHEGRITRDLGCALHRKFVILAKMIPTMHENHATQLTVEQGVAIANVADTSREVNRYLEIYAQYAISTMTWPMVEAVMAALRTDVEATEHYSAAATRDRIVDMWVTKP